MKKILILGSGAGGTMVANNLRRKLGVREWDITIIDNDEVHHYQPGWLFIPFDVYSPEDCQKPKREFIPEGVNFVLDEVVGLDTAKRKVEGKKGKYDYDWLVIGTGCAIVPEEVDGMMDDWRKNIHDFYTLDGAIALREKMRYFASGRVVLNIAELPYKCPVAPLEYIFMADWFFDTKGVRDDVEIELVTPMAGAFSKPIASGILSDIAIQKNIKVTPNFDIAQVNADEKTIESHRGDKIDYDLLVAIPPNFGAQFLEGSGLEDPLRFVDTDHFTLKAKNADHIFVV
ncbi:MAG: FAD-dependent oxidoreductase, partial [Desulfobacterales bacterium]